MGGDVVLWSRAQAPWLPPGGRADVVLAGTGSAPPQPCGLVRLLIIGEAGIYCAPRAGRGHLDLPTRDCASGEDPAAAGGSLALDVYWQQVPLRLYAWVVNTVPDAPDDYPWPAPTTCFTIWLADTTLPPTSPGEWIARPAAPAQLGERHWWPAAAHALAL